MQRPILLRKVVVELVYLDRVLKRQDLIIFLEEIKLQPILQLIKALMFLVGELTPTLKHQSKSRRQPNLVNHNQPMINLSLSMLEQEVIKVRSKKIRVWNKRE